MPLASYKKENMKTNIFFCIFIIKSENGVGSGVGSGSGSVSQRYGSGGLGFRISTKMSWIPSTGSYPGRRCRRSRGRACPAPSPRTSSPPSPSHRCSLRRFILMGRRPLPALRDLTRDGRWSTYDVSVLKLYNVSFWGRCARKGHPLKLPSPTKLARLGHFPPASPVFYNYLYVFSLIILLYIIIQRKKRS